LPKNQSDAPPQRRPGRAPMRRRLWELAGILLVALSGVLIVEATLPRDRAITRGMLGQDFLAFYTAGTFVRTGQTDKLYDLAAVREFEHQVGASAGLDIGDRSAPWWNPPFAAIPLAPLSLLPFPLALDAWWMASVLALAGSALILCRFLPAGDSTDRLDTLKTRGLVPVLIVCSWPCLQAFCHGQNSFFSLLIVSGTVALWRERRAIAAGLVGGLLMYKPQLGVIVAGAMLLTLGPRALVGLAITGGALLCANLLVLPGTIGPFLHQVPASLHYLQTQKDYFWQRHVTLLAYFRLAAQGHAIGPISRLTTSLWLVIEIPLSAALVWCAVRLYRLRGEGAEGALDRFVAASLACSPLLMPFYFDYDLLLLAVPATLIAAEAMRRPLPNRRLPLTFAAVYIVGFVAIPIANATNMQPTTVVLTLLATQLVARAMSVTADGPATELIRDNADSGRAMAA
jgi:hypothetical protein